MTFKKFEPIAKFIPMGERPVPVHLRVIARDPQTGCQESVFVEAFMGKEGATVVSIHAAGETKQ